MLCMCMRNDKIAIIISKKLLSVVNLIEFSAKTVLLVQSKDLVDLHKICYSKGNFFHETSSSFHIVQFLNIDSFKTNLRICNRAVLDALDNSMKIQNSFP